MSKIIHFNILILLQFCLKVVPSVRAFTIVNNGQKLAGIHHGCSGTRSMAKNPTITSVGLLESVTSSPQNQSLIKSQIAILESTFQHPPADADDLGNDVGRFAPLVGLYDVSATLTARPNDNPVGGKWTRSNGAAQKFLKTRRTFQHILPVNETGCGNRIVTQRDSSGSVGELTEVVGEAINVISLDALFGWLRLHVILRGDAVPLTLEERTNATRVVQPLSQLAVKALFDPPCIVLGQRFPISVGPKTAVLLDTTYCDDLIRIGMGGTSGTRFVFGRCPEGDVEANEFRALLRLKPVKKVKALLSLGTVVATGVFTALVKNAKYRLLRAVVGGAVSVMSSILFGLVAFSSGGIERDDMGVVMRKEGETAAPPAATGATS